MTAWIYVSTDKVVLKEVKGQFNLFTVMRIKVLEEPSAVFIRVKLKERADSSKKFIPFYQIQNTLPWKTERFGFKYAVVQ
jgi:hypothetical protein